MIDEPGQPLGRGDPGEGQGGRHQDDRLRPAHAGRSADYYVSFDNTRSARCRARAWSKCLGEQPAKKIISIERLADGQQRHAVQDGAIVRRSDARTTRWSSEAKATPEWDNVAGGTIFEQLFTAAGGKVDGVLAANDGLANAVIQVLKRTIAQVPVTGQDATVEGLQNILRGDQCMTVYKAIKKEADAAADARDRTGQRREAATTQRHGRGRPRRTGGCRRSCSTPEPIYKDTSRRSSTTASSPRPRSARRTSPRSATEARDHRQLGVGRTTRRTGRGEASASGARSERQDSGSMSERKPCLTTARCSTFGESTRASAPCTCCTTSTSTSIPARSSPLVGDNGAGKSTLVKSRGGHPPDRLRRDHLRGQAGHHPRAA